MSFMHASSLVNDGDDVVECCREDIPVLGVEAHYSDVEEVLARLRSCCAQFDIDGTHNVWIVKPGAKSRGRGKSARHRSSALIDRPV